MCLAEGDADGPRVRRLDGPPREAHTDGRLSEAIDALRTACELRADPSHLNSTGRRCQRLRAADCLSPFVEQATDPSDRADAEAVFAVVRLQLERAGGRVERRQQSAGPLARPLWSEACSPRPDS